MCDNNNNKKKTKKTTKPWLSYCLWGKWAFKEDKLDEKPRKISPILS